MICERMDLCGTDVELSQALDRPHVGEQLACLLDLEGEKNMSVTADGRS